jgi:uncharacterized repeat protein (TIGR01451 family)/CSLREA domain-containing protein
MAGPRSCLRHTNGWFASLLKGAVASAVVVMFPLTAAVAVPVEARATFNVNRLTDAVDTNPGNGVCQIAGGGCSLRAAIMEANALEGPDIINVPASTFNLTIAGGDEEGSQSGDLDVRDDVTINGQGSGSTIIVQTTVDRVLDLPCIGGCSAQDLILSGVTVRDGQVPAGSSLPFGGGIRDYGDSLSLSDVVLTNNDAPEADGGGLAKLTGSAVNFTDVTATANTALNGGGIFVAASGPVSVAGLVASGNSATQFGGAGGIHVSSSAQPINMDDVTVAGNTGNGLILFGNGTLTNATITDNDSNAEGGGIKSAGDLAISDSVVSGNSAINLGGGLYMEGGSLTDVVVHGNTAGNDGGGIDSISTLTLTRVAVTGNSVTARNGGGIQHQGGLLTATNVTVSGNSAPAPASRGGGLHLGPGVAPVLTNVTVTGNTGGDGSGLNTESAVEPPVLRNVIVTGNLGSPDCAGPIDSLGNNLDGGDSCSFDQPTDLVNANAALGPLTDVNETKVHPLLPGSEAFDAGTNTGCPSTDQRGAARPLDGDFDGTATCDIGAYEGEPLADVSVSTTDAPDPVTIDGDVTYTVAVANGGHAQANGVTLTDTIPPGSSFVSATPSQGGPCTFAAGVVNCPLGTILRGAVATVEVVVTAPGVPGTITNQSSAAITGGPADPNPSNNSDSENTQVTLPRLSISDVAAAEGSPPGQTAFDFTVTLSDPIGSQATVEYDTADGSATIADNDYAGTSGVVTFAPNDTSETVTVQVSRDTKKEGDETFFVDLSNPSANAEIQDGQGQGTVLNDDPDPVVSISDPAAVTEGNPPGGTPVAFDVCLSGSTDATAAVHWAAADGTATLADGDYQAVSGDLSWAPGESGCKTATVEVVRDTRGEANETLLVDLSAPENATIGDPQAVVTILNDDVVLPDLSINDAQVNEGNAGTRNLVFTVTLSEPSAQTVTVQYTTADGSATAGQDYTGVVTPVTLTFVPGDTSENLAIQIIGDTVYENGNESFFVNLSSPTNAEILDGQGQGTILEDDPLTDCTVTGTNGNDTNLRGTSGNDVICGLGGNDTIYGLGGNDEIDGGAGIDTVSYNDSSTTGAVTVRLYLDTASGPGAGTDTLAGIESAIGSRFNDLLYGDGLANSLSGVSGQDTINGLNGNDTLNGGTGADTASYFLDAVARITVTLRDLPSLGTSSGTGHGTDSIRDLEDVVGTAFNDVITGNSTGNVLTGQLGNDTIKGGNGDDVIHGNGGADNLYGQEGNRDQAYGDAQFDPLISGGPGADDWCSQGDGSERYEPDCENIPPP